MTTKAEFAAVDRYEANRRKQRTKNHRDYKRLCVAIVGLLAWGLLPFAVGLIEGWMN